MPTIPMSEFQAMLAKAEPSAAASMSAQMGDVSKNTDEVNKLNSTLKSVAETMNQVSTALKRVGTDLDGLKNKAEQLNRFNATFATQIGKMSRDDIVQLQKAFKGLSGIISQLPEDVKRSLQQASTMIDELEKKTEGAWNTTQRFFTKGAGRDLMQPIVSGVQSQMDSLIPTPLQKFGIWGLLIGMVVGAQQRFRAEAASILADWNRATAGVGTGVDSLKDRLAAAEVRWKFIASKEELVSVWKKASLVIDQTGTSIDGFIDKTMNLDVAMGVQFGSTIEHVGKQMLMYNANARTMTSEMSKMGAIFRDNIGPTNVWLQTVMDMQARLGNLGVNTKNLATTFDLFAGSSQKMGGGMAQAQQATEELFGFFGKMGMPIQAMLGQAMGLGTSAAGNIVGIQRILNFQQGEFGKKMPEMLGTLFEKFGMYGRSADENALIMQKQLGFSEKTSIIMADLIEKNPSKSQFQEAFAKSNAAQNAMAVDTKDVKQMMKESIPAWTRLLESVVRILIEILNFIGDGLAGLMAIQLSTTAALIKGMYSALGRTPPEFLSNILDPAAAVSVVLGSLGKRMDSIRATVETMGPEAAAAAKDLVPGAGILSEVLAPGIVKKEAAKPDKGGKQGYWGAHVRGLKGLWDWASGGGEGASAPVPAGGATPSGGTAPSGGPGGGGFNPYETVMPGGPVSQSPVKTTAVAGGLAIEGKFVWTLTDSEAKEFQNALAKAGTTSAPEATGQ